MTAVASRIAVSPVRTKDDLREFLRFPWKIYRPGKPWVPPLLDELEELFDRDRHPFYDHGDIQPFLARSDGEVVGRIAATFNQTHLDLHKDGVGFFGFFESIDDDTVAQPLFDAASAWLAERGIERMRGPISPTVNDEVGLLLDSFDQRPVFMMAFNPPYYADLFERCGLEKVRTLYAYLATREHHGAKHERLADRVSVRHGVTIRNLVMKRVEEEAKILEGIYNQAWQELWGYVPMTDREVLVLTRKLKRFADERMILIAEVQGEPAAFALAVPDLNQVLVHLNGKLGLIGTLKAAFYRRRMKGMRLMAMGIKREHRRKGIESLLIRELFARGKPLGYEYMEVSWILEDNAQANNILRRLDFEPYRTWGLFERPVRAG